MITIKNRKMIMGTISAASVLVNSLFVAPVALAAEQPSIDAKAAFVIEDETDKVLMNQNGDEALGIASMTKMLSIYLILEAIEEGKLTWDKQITVSDYVYEVSQNYNFSNVPLRQDITYSVEELYQSALIYSANGSTIALAEALAGSEAKFVDLMKAQLDEWGVDNYELYNTTGLSNSDMPEEHLYPGASSDGYNKMTARGVAMVADHLIDDYPEVLETTAVPELAFQAGTSDEIMMHSYNLMLPGMFYYREGVDGLKTGTTLESGASFTGTAVQDDMRIITVVIGADESTKRFKETGRLMDYAFSTFEKTTVATKGEAVSTQEPITVAKGKQTEVGLVYNEDLVTVTEKGAEELALTTVFTPAEESLNEDGEIEAPIEKGTEVGSVAVTVEGDEFGYLDGATSEDVKVAVASSVEKANIFVRGGRVVGDLFGKAWQTVSDFVGGFFD